jgi:hypothetical protein
MYNPKSVSVILLFILVAADVGVAFPTTSLASTAEQIEAPRVDLDAVTSIQAEEAYDAGPGLGGEACAREPFLQETTSDREEQSGNLSSTGMV